MQNPDRKRVRDPEGWEAELPDDGLDVHQRVAAEVRVIGVRCRFCGRGYHAAVMPWSPILAKSPCPSCSQVNEVTTRESVMTDIEAGFEHNHDVARVAAHPKVFPKDLGKVKTRFGDAYLID